MTEVYDHLTDDWQSWTGILNEDQAKQLVKTLARRSFNQPEETEMAKTLYVVTQPTTITAVVAASDDAEAGTAALAKIKAVLAATLGVITVVGEAKVTAVASGKAKASKDDELAKKSKKKDEPEEEEEDGEEAEEEEEEEEDGEEEEEEEDGDEAEEEEEEEEEEDEPVKKKSSDKKADKSDKKKPSDKDEGKKKVKIKLNGK